MKIPRFDIRTLYSSISQSQKEERKNRKLRTLALVLRARARGEGKAARIPQPVLVITQNPEEVWSVEMMQEEVIIPLVEEFPDAFTGWDFEIDGEIVSDEIDDLRRDEQGGDLEALLWIRPGKEFAPAGDGRWDFSRARDLEWIRSNFVEGHGWTGSKVTLEYRQPQPPSGRWE